REVGYILHGTPVPHPTARRWFHAPYLARNIPRRRARAARVRPAERAAVCPHAGFAARVFLAQRRGAEWEHIRRRLGDREYHRDIDQRNDHLVRGRTVVPPRPLLMRIRRMQSQRGGGGEERHAECAPTPHLVFVP